MKVLVISNYYKPAYTYGGPVQSISTLYETMADLGIQVTVFTTNANGNKRLDVLLGQPIDVDGVEVFYFPLVSESTPLGRFFVSPQLGKACGKRIHEFDIVAIQGIWTYPFWVAARSCKKNSVPYIVSLRGDGTPAALRRGQLKKRIYFNLFVRHLLNQASAIHCTAPSELADIESLKLLPRRFIVPNSVDASKYENLPSQGKMRQRFNISENAIVLLMLGRIHSIKRPFMAVDALIAAQSLPQQVHLIIAGPDEGNLRSSLEKQAGRFGCLDNLHFTGLLEGDDVRSCLADSDLLLMPSESESFGMAAAEALAVGVPVLVSDKVPVGYWADEGGAGKSVACFGSAFVQATCELLADAERLSVMGKRGPNIVRENFDSSIVAQQTIEQYRAIVSQDQSPNRIEER